MDGVSGAGGDSTGPRFGALRWREAEPDDELLAPTVAETVMRLDIDAYVSKIDPALADTEALCEAFDLPLDACANCVIVTGHRGERVRTAALLVLAEDRADVNRTARKRLDVRKLSFAPVEAATSQTGMEYGGITPIGLPASWPVLVDRAVIEQPWVIVGSGIRASKLALRGADIAALPPSEVLDLALPRG